MDTNDKLIDDVKAALRAAGYGNIIARTSDPGVVISAEKGTAGAVFYLTSQIAGKATASSTATGGRTADADKVKAMVAPTVAGVEELMRAEPARAAELLGMSTSQIHAVLDRISR
ncbi:hypothetical protein GCM10011611_46690 [Aliidongia dinghuensis]|uniref:Uncharacterized protein n=1 Tax=Aliidongia dinghuensis TaxID=1867774 RepID=A0A8J2YY49_9PROT|nr:hypothetical protein [Aliidongia dinghuensis]GGF35099.1 hypothetical protein GCM10011611_46690 [Aliidongia dinghuensis]